MRRPAGLATVVGIVLLCLWLTMPPHRVALDESCQPADILAELAAAVHPDAFWQAQATATADALEQLAALPAATERANEAQRGSMSSIESRMSRLSSNETGSASEQQQAEAREQRSRLERMGWLIRCQSAIARRLAH
jgi:hypothetical protein